MNIVFLIIGLVIGGLLIFLFLRPKLKKVQLDTNKIYEEIKKQEDIYSSLIEKNEKLKTDFSEKSLVFNEQLNRLYQDVSILETNKNNLKSSIEELRAEATKSTEEIYNTSYKLMQEKLDKAAEELSKQYETAKDKCVREYLTALQESNEDFMKQFADLHQKLSIAKEELAEYRAKADAAINAAKREEEKLLQLDKYKINLSDLDLLEINRLREIAPYFRNARAIYKIIWESYYRNPTTDLINRVIGTSITTGIYKLTNLKNSKVYIGQAVDIGSRWKEHIKAGLGIDTPNSILYNGMREEGVENFTFEILEICPGTQLNNRETYWIEFYRSREHGYNMTKGGSSKK